MKKLKLLGVALIPVGLALIMLVWLSLVSRQQVPATIRSVRDSSLQVRNNWRCLRTSDTFHEVIGIINNRANAPVDGVTVGVELYKTDGLYWRSDTLFLGDFKPYESRSFRIWQIVPPGIEIGICEIKLFDQRNTLLNYRE